MLQLQRLLNNELELHDCVGSYGFSSMMEDAIKEDEKGKYRTKHIFQEAPCGCHPETCCHFDGRITRHSTQKIYLTEQEVLDLKMSKFVKGEIGSSEWYRNVTNEVIIAGEQLLSKQPSTEEEIKQIKKLPGLITELLTWLEK